MTEERRKLDSVKTWCSAYKFLEEKLKLVEYDSQEYQEIVEKLKQIDLKILELLK